MPDKELATYTERTDYAAKGVIVKIVNLGKDDETVLSDTKNEFWID